MKSGCSGSLSHADRVKHGKVLLITLLVVSAASLIECATGSQARNVKPSGFLGDHRSLLQPGKVEGDELLVYQNPNADWSAYKSIQLEPVTIWTDPHWKLSGNERKDLQKLVDSFQATLYQKLSTDYEMVELPGPGVMRLQVAITDGRRSATALKVVSQGVPFRSAATFLWSFITGKPPFVGEASIETMVKDAQTGDLLWASADRRVGADTIVAADSINTEYLNSWGDVKYSLDYWSDGAVYRLCRLRGGSNCVKPKKGLKLPG